MNKLRIILLAIVFISGLTSGIVRAATASQVLAKASSKIRSAKGIDCGFTVSSSGHTLNGMLKCAGSKFQISAGGNVSWYNGKDLYTYVSSSNETTVVKPTASELAEANPLAYLQGYSAQYNASFSKNTPKGKYVVDLIPKTRKAAARKVTVTLNSATYTPEKLVITALDKSITIVKITKLTFLKSISASTFEYPKSRYARATVVDLR